MIQSTAVVSYDEHIEYTLETEQNFLNVIMHTINEIWNDSEL